MTDSAGVPIEGEQEFEKSAPADRSSAGPLDENESGAIKPSVDLGSLRVEPQRGMQLRMEVDKSNDRAVAVTLEYQGSTVQLQPFAAPRSSGLWHPIRAQIQQQIASQGGTALEADGPFGPELVASVPVQADGQFGTRKVRFIGIDGPRWFLRAVIGGEAASDAEAAVAIHRIIRSVVVVRGNTPLPPRDLLPLQVPATPGTSSREAQ
ncbi:DUF3710 domain-containing protein [Pontimonas sp.]|nr:DUF3710 domain-containing protein [Pontimonas sp.]MDB4606946.1 DUF3710 domain-containing protein [Pontimonas sp.]